MKKYEENAYDDSANKITNTDNEFLIIKILQRRFPQKKHGHYK